MAKYFIRIYRDILDDPKFGRLPDDLWRFAIELMLIVNDRYEIPDIDELAFRLHKSNAEISYLLSRLNEERPSFIGLVDGTRIYDQYCRLKLRHKSVSRVMDEDLRLKIFDRDHCLCVYCGEWAEHIDHVVPVCQGGTDAPDNLVASCASCNMKKGGRTPEQAGMDMKYG